MTFDEKLKVATPIIEVLKIVAWPLVVGWLAWYLRDEFKRAAGRLTEVGFSGAKFAPPLEQVPATSVSVVAAAAATLSTADPAKPGSGPQQIIERIKMTISPEQLDPAVQSGRSDLLAAVGTDLAAQNEVMTYALAALNIQLWHERNYAAIFGSQLQLLAQMNIDVGVPPSVARQIYDAAKAANPDVYRTYTFDQWIAFLQNSSLISVAPTGNYVLTPWGRGLLRYILDRHLSVNKPF